MKKILTTLGWIMGARVHYFMKMMFRSFLAPPRPARVSPKKISPFRKSSLGPAGDKLKGDPYNFDEILSMSESSQEK